MIESMACGSPVIVLNKGSAPEVVVDGKTGFIVNSLNAMVAALEKIPRIDRLKCRDHVQENFNVKRMADNYLRTYEGILSESEVKLF
jgi:glycosyltransferase involved in cell wall biosynthesis